jgi:SAM-dependent methyltransferase
VANQDSFTGFFAEFYDILHAGLEDVDAYLDFGSRYGPRILELGSGTGRELIPLARAGFTVTGVDASADMMSICRQRLAYEPPEVRARVTLVQVDVLDLDLADRFDLAIAPCNFINYFTGQGESRKVLRTALRHLSGEGTFLLENGVPDLQYMRSINGLEQEFEFEHPLTGTTLLYRVTARYDFANQTEVDDMELEEREDGRIVRVDKANETLAFYSPRQIRAMLRSEGFQISHEQGSLVEDIPISESGGEMVFLCRRRDLDASNRTRGTTKPRDTRS